MICLSMKPVIGLKQTLFMEECQLVITTERIIIAVVAVGALFFIQRRGQRKSEEYLKRLQEKQHREAEAQMETVENTNEDNE